MDLMFLFARPNYPVDAPPYILPSPLPQPTRRVKPVLIPETPQKTGVKRPFPLEIEDSVLDLAPTPKKPKLAERTTSRSDFGPSPSKKRRLEEDGVVVMDGPDEVLEDESIHLGSADIIIIDED